MVCPWDWEPSRNLIFEKVNYSLIRSGSWYAHSEHILTSLLASSVQEDRLWALNKIFEIRAGSEFGHKKFRARNDKSRGAFLNLDANSIKDLLLWDSNGFKPTEPPLTLHYSTSELYQFVHSPLSLPDLGSTHTQVKSFILKNADLMGQTICLEKDLINTKYYYSDHWPPRHLKFWSFIHFVI